MGRSRRCEAMLVLLVLLVLLGPAEALPEVCSLPKVVGRCRAAFPRWWYNTTSQACQEFIYGGCRSNGNNFVTEEECLQKCDTGGGGEAAEIPSTSQGGAMLPATEAAPTSGHRHEPGDDRIGFKEFCAAPQAVGPCRASFPRWYFDTETRTCKMFIYGGCGGNKNNYVFEEHCLSQCTGDGAITEEPEEPKTHSHLFPDPMIHSTRAVVLAVLLALMAAALLGSMVVFFVKLCRRSQELSLGTVWSTLDDKEYLMSNAYTL
ncbi:kunitz-type protease inhibitor 2 [Rhineura floridana]|uniref:kunitz-type protease inhibitor 2 n=1 Tax=Rhineura floridana TaxID=261503 RepID=UPI002AC873F0|nr:kunitz-type protease inhibitor 2 [Rhineura floridana]